MEDFLLLNIPLFRVKYKRWEKYGYTKVKEKDNTKRALCNASGGYCMYCYSRIKTDNKLYGNLEHAIEKSNSPKLLECIPNLGMACMICNQSFKRIGERKRRISLPDVRQFERQSRCALEQRKQCTVPCKALRKLQIIYSEIPGAEIILQPMGIYGQHSKEPFALQYDVLKMEFQPNTALHNYTEEELIFIKKHILRFRLNDAEYRTHELGIFVKNIVDNGGILPEYEYNNLIVQLFADTIRNKSAKERLSICSKIYPVMFLKM